MRIAFTWGAIAIIVLFASVPAAAQTCNFGSFGNSTVPSCCFLVGSDGHTGPAGMGFQVIVRDLANNPCTGATVTIDLSHAPDLHLCSDPLDPNATVDCAAKTIRKLTDANGRVSFTLLGGSNGGDPVEQLSAGRIFANGTLIASPTVSAFDLDGVNGVGVNDLSLWLHDFGTAGNPAFGRDDYDCSGGVGVNDLSVWLAAFGSGTQVQSCAASCP